MGGKNPVIVDASANIADAGRKIAWGRVANAGEIFAPDYALVDERCREALRRASLARPWSRCTTPTARVTRNPGTCRASSIVATRSHQAACSTMRLPRARSSNPAARPTPRTCSSRRRSCPTSAKTCVIMSEEVFASDHLILPLQKSRGCDRDDPSADKPLGSYIFAKDRAAIDWYLARTSSGSTVVNHNLIQSGTNPHLRPSVASTPAARGVMAGASRSLNVPTRARSSKTAIRPAIRTSTSRRIRISTKKMITQFLGMKFTMPGCSGQPLPRHGQGHERLRKVARQPDNRQRPPLRWPFCYRRRTSGLQRSAAVRLPGISRRCAIAARPAVLRRTRAHIEPGDAHAHPRNPRRHTGARWHRSAPSPPAINRIWMPTTSRRAIWRSNRTPCCRSTTTTTATVTASRSQFQISRTFFIHGEVIRPSTYQ